MELYHTNDRDYMPKVCAHVIGRKLKVMLETDIKLKDRVLNILTGSDQGFWENIVMGLKSN